MVDTGKTKKYKNGKEKVDKRQVSKIRYVPEKELPTYDGKVRTRPAMWKGVIKSGQYGQTQAIPLDNKWVEENIPEKFRELLMEVRNRDGYVQIPEGADKRQDQQLIPDVQNAPPARYWNGHGNTENRRCAWLSAASGLFHLGLTNLAEAVAALNDETPGWENPFQLMFQTLQDKSSKMERQKYSVCKLGKKNRSKWDMMSSTQKYQLCALGLKGLDGKTDHAICVVGKWIFDSNFEKALPLTKQSLNICCSSADKKTKFSCATRGLMMSYKSTPL